MHEPLLDSQYKQEAGIPFEEHPLLLPTTVRDYLGSSKMVLRMELVGRRKKKMMCISLT
jgi:hypothetical protein